MAEPIPEDEYEIVMRFAKRSIDRLESLPPGWVADLLQLLAEAEAERDALRTALEAAEARAVPEGAQRRTTYRNADGEPVVGEYSFVDGTEWWEDDDQLSDVVKEVWVLASAETLHLPENLVQSAEGPCIYCDEDRDGGADVGCIADWHEEPSSPPRLVPLSPTDTPEEA